MINGNCVLLAGAPFIINEEVHLFTTGLMIAGFFGYKRCQRHQREKEDRIIRIYGSDVIKRIIKLINNPIMESQILRNIILSYYYPLR